MLSASPARGAGSKLDDQLSADFHAGAPGAIQIASYSNLGDGSLLAQTLKNLGSTDLSRHGHEIDAMIPIANLGRLAKLRTLRFATITSATTSVGAVTTQGDSAIATAAARATYGLTGAGVKIGILSDSFNDAGLVDTYATDVASGDLPSGVQILAEDPSVGTDEGRAMAQIIYDEAPSATFAFATAVGGQATMAANITSLVNAGCKIIVDDYEYLNEPFFEDGVVAQAAESAIARGVTFISAAGNTGSDSYASTWQSANTYSAGAIPSAAGAPLFYGGTSFNFGTASALNDMNSFTLAPGQSIHMSLQWDSPYYSVSGGSGSQNSVDAYVLNSTGTQIIAGAVNQDVGHDPIQLFTYTNNGNTAQTYNLMLINEVGAVPGYIKYIDFAGQATNWAYAENSGTIFGHVNAGGVDAIGAAYYANTPAYGVSPPVLEPTSSTGGTPIFFDTSGNRLATAVNRQTPNLVAADGVYTTFFGTTAPGNLYPSFYGTSAAAAGAAGAAALLLQKAPTLTPAQVAVTLQNTAAAISSPVPNSTSGYGLIQASNAVAGIVGNISGTIYQDNNDNGTLDAGEPGVAGVTVYVDAKNTGSYVSTDISTVTASDGTFTLQNVPTGSAVIRFVTPGGFIAITGGKTVTAGTTVTGVNFGVFPDAFAGTAGNYNYTVQADARTNTLLDILVNNVLTYSVTRSLLPALTFTLGGINNSLTVNFANGTPIPTGGLTYDCTSTTATGNILTINGTTGNDTASVNSLTTIYNGSSIFSTGLQSEVINGNNGNDAFTIINSQPLGTTLTFNGGTGNTSLLVKNALLNSAANFFNAGTTATDQNSLTVSAGTWTFSGDPAATSANLTVNDNATVVFTAGATGSGINARHLAALNIGATAIAQIAAPPTHADRQLLVTNTLSITTGGKLDLSGNDAVITSGNIATLTGLLTTGFAGGLWNGAGIQSTAAAAGTGHLTAIGSLLNTAANGQPIYGSGTTLGLFDGISPATTAVLLKYTYYGDANLSGTVDGSDYPLIDNGFNNLLTGWYNGDFNYDGVLNGSDYTLIDNAFNTQPTGL